MLLADWLMGGYEAWNLGQNWIWGGSNWTECWDSIYSTVLTVTPRRVLHKSWISLRTYYYFCWVVLRTIGTCEASVAKFRCKLTFDTGW